MFLFSDGLIHVLQLLFATCLGMMLGLERILAGRTAGPRTYALVSLGGCLLTILSLNSSQLYRIESKADPASIVAAVVTGIGFLGAGLIIFKGSKLSGLTTAAGIWVAAAIGIAVGFGFYILAVSTAILTLFIFTVMWKFEHHIKAKFRYKSGHSGKKP
jgi:putative Mg2+ transporter-C (MgtC) family protein